MTTRHITFIFVLLMVAIGLAACAGFDLGDIVKVRTPHAVQQMTGLPARTSLNAAETEYRAWFETVQRTGTEWKAAIESGNEVRALLGQLTLTALDQIGPTLAGVPVVGPALPALTGLVGLFLGAGRLRKEKEASFNKGLKEGRNGNGNDNGSGNGGAHA